MTKTQKAFLGLGLLVSLISLHVSLAFGGRQPVIVNPMSTTPETLTHAQEVWIYALEWCESNGLPTAINELDLDGTPSYYSFQFKPGTFKSFGKIYLGLEIKTESELMELLKSYDLQRAIVERMVLDPTTQWERQFPGCVRKLGRPPLY